MVTGWRIVKTKYAHMAFDGEGARLYGGRWNSPGVRMVYASQSLSLAALEILVHLNKSSLLSHYSYCAFHFDKSMLHFLDPSVLPPHWRREPVPPETQVIGDHWIHSQTSLALAVPSAIIETEFNYLINPNHPDFSSAVMDPPQPFTFDARLLP